MIYLISDFDTAIENEMRGDGNETWCDAKGTVYKTDLITEDSKEVERLKSGGAQVLATFPDKKSIVYFGGQIYEGSSRSSVDFVNKQMAENGFDATARKAVLAAHAALYPTLAADTAAKGSEFVPFEPRGRTVENKPATKPAPV